MSRTRNTKHDSPRRRARRGPKNPRIPRHEITKPVKQTRGNDRAALRTQDWDR